MKGLWRPNSPFSEVLGVLIVRLPSSDPSLGFLKAATAFAGTGSYQ